jgi:hypothetical protein
MFRRDFSLPSRRLFHAVLDCIESRSSEVSVDYTSLWPEDHFSYVLCPVQFSEGLAGFQINAEQLEIQLNLSKQTNKQRNKQTNSVAYSSQANYTD